MLSTLAKLIERRPPPPRPAEPTFVSPNAARGSLHALLRFADVHPSELEARPSAKQAMLANCTVCKHRGECRLWMAQNLATRSLAPFCANAPHVERLAGQRFWKQRQAN